MPYSTEDVYARIVAPGIAIGSKEADEELYAIVAEEVFRKDVVPGLMAKSFADASGDEQKAGAMYLKRRVKVLTTEIAQIAKRVRRESREEAEHVENDELREWRYRGDDENWGRSLMLFVVGGAILVLIVLVMIKAN